MRWTDNFKQAYLRSSKNLIEARGRSADSSYEVGGSFDAIGYLEKQLLLHHGLMPNHSLVDIGCGSGRVDYHCRLWIAWCRYKSVRFCISVIDQPSVIALAS